MADVNANIGVNIDTSNALAQLKALQRQISQFHTSISKSSEAAALAQRDLQRNFINSVNSIGAFSAELRTVRTTAESFTDSLEKNKFSMREYFRYAGGATKTFSRLFKSEFDTVNKVAEENVKRLQTQYIKMGRDASGAMRAIAVMPNQLDMSNASTQLQMAAQRQAIFNQLLKQGSTNLLNFGKNTQWAGRQLMVGFTLPLASLGAVASRTFMDMETAALKFRKVYGDLFTPEEERQQALADIQALGQSFTQYGISVASTVSLAGDAAAAGFQGLDLQRQVTEATRLQVLGQIDQQKALETTISLQNAFKLSNEDLSESINFLNAVENQTVVSLDDITTAIPKVAPVIMQLGGNVKDLAFFMTAMKQGGVNASEGANALKSGLAALINPTEKASAMLADMGINIKKIVEGNQGNLRATVVDFAKALDTLDPLTRARAIEQLFGKFQFARLSTLFENVTAGGTQAARVLDLAGYSAEDLAATAESELGMTADNAMNRFRKTVEDLKFALVPVGQTFLEAVTPIVDFVGNILEKFNGLSSGVKKALVILTVAIGAIGPVALMTFGLLANGLANIVKGAMILRNGYLRLTGQTQVLGEQTQYLTVEQQNALAVASSLDQSHARLIQTFTSESVAVQRLAESYDRAIAAGARFSQTNPGMMRQPFLPGFQDGIISVPGSGTGDKYPAMLAAGEAVIPARQNKKYAPLIAGIIADNIPGFQYGNESIGERFVSSRLGRNLSGGERAQVNIPGGYQLGHFAEAMKISGEELRRLAETQTQTFKVAVEKLIDSAGGDITRMFDIFTNEVTVQSKELNQALGEVGSGRLAPKAMFEREAVQQAGAYNAPILAKMKDAGATAQDLDDATLQLSTAFSQGIEELGSVTVVTAEQVNDITQKAYEKVATVNEKLKVAREELREFGALKEVAGVTTGRTSLRGGYNTKQVKQDINAVVQQQAPGLYPTQQAFNFTGEAARKAGVQNAFAIREVFDQLEQEAKTRVIALLGDIDAMSQQVVLEARNAGIDIGKYAIQGIAEGTASTSPSREARQQGQNVVDGFEQGILDGMDDASLAGQQLGNAGIDGIDKGTGGGSGARRSAGAGGNGEAARTTANFAKLNSAMMGTSFALTSISGVASAFGGRFQGLSEMVFKLSGLMFGLMSMVQLLTQEMFANVIANRANKVASTMGATSFKGLFANTAGFGSKLLTAGKFLTRFAGGIGALVGVVTLSIAAFKLVNREREKERKVIMGLADAANLTADKLKTLGDFFGIKPTENPMLQAVPQIRMTAQRRGRVDELKASEGFQKQFGADIEELRKATAKEAEIVFKSLALSLAGQGFAQEQIKDIIDALREEAGKIDVKIDVKSLDLGTEEGSKQFKQLASDITNQLAVAAKNGYEEIQVLQGGISETGQYYSQWVTQLKPTVALQRAAAASGQELFNMMTGLAGGLKNGSVSAGEFNKGFAQLESVMKAVEKTNPGAALLMMQAAIKQLNPETQKLFEGLTKTQDVMLMMRAQALGLTAILPGLASALKAVNAGYTGDATSFVQAQLDLERYKKMLEAAAKESEEWIKKITGGGKTGGDGEKSAFQKAIEQLQQQRKELLNTSVAYDKLKKAGVDTARAFEIAQDPILAAAIATTKVGTEKWKKLLGLIKDVNKELLKAELKNFFETRNAEVKFQQNFAQIIPQLQGLGLEVKDIQDILSNPALAQQFIKDLKDGQLNVLELKRYIDQIPELKKIEILLETPEEQFQQAFDDAMEYFNTKSELLDAEYKPKLVNAEKEVDQARQAVDAIESEIDSLQKAVDKAQRDVEINFNRPIEALQEEISDLQRSIEINIDRPIEELNKQISQLQRNIELQFDRPIGALQEESSDLANDLTLIDKAAEGINAKYDAQEQALQKISDINQEIINQEKSKLSVADALTRGDIAAAAQAAQEAKAQAAATAAERAGGTLQAAREAELAGLRGPSGLTREQIEQRQFQIGQQIFALEEQREIVQAQILLKQDQIYTIEQGRLPLLEQIRSKEDQIYALEEAREAAVLAIRAQEDAIYNLQVNRLAPAQEELDKKEKALKAVEAELKARQDAIDLEKQKWIEAELALKQAQVEAGKYDGVLAGIQAKTKAALDNIKGLNTTVTTTHIINTIYTSSGNSGGGGAGGGNATAQLKMYGGKIKKMAIGGVVPGRGMTDKVPALLTPGEFVVNKNATRSFGPMLSKINESKYPSMMKDSFSSPAYKISSDTSVIVPTNNVNSSISDNSNTVYNYSVGITVGGTNANPDSIARAVMNEIKYIDSQRIRGQRAV